jgi:hypothetical protein
MGLPVSMLHLDIDKLAEEWHLDDQIHELNLQIVWLKNDLTKCLANRLLEEVARLEGMILQKQQQKEMLEAKLWQLQNN